MVVDETDDLNIGFVRVREALATASGDFVSVAAVLPQLLLACYAPARGAMRVHPLTALHSE